MSDLIFNIAKGRLATFGSLPAANDAIQVVPLLTAGIVGDAAMSDYTTLAAVLAGATDEQTAMGRKTAANVTVTVDQTNDRVDIDCDDITWSGATGGAIAAVLFFYNPDTTASGQGVANDANCVPIAKFDFAVVPNGGDITAQIPTGGFARAQ